MHGPTLADLENWFTHHPPTDGQIPKYTRIREAGLVFARTVLTSTPEGPDQTTAIRKIREAVMTANAAIACAPEVKL